MINKLGKVFATEYYFYFSNWSFYFSAGYFCCKKNNELLPNEI